MAAERYQSALVTADDADPDPLAFALSLDSLRAGFGLGASGLRMRRQIELALMFMLCDGSSPLIRPAPRMPDTDQVCRVAWWP